VATLAEIERALEEGLDREHRLDWAGALAHYRAQLSALGGLPQDADHLRVRSYARLREANALMTLERDDEARGAFDAALDDAQGAGDRLGLARALIGAGVFAANTGDLERGEAFLLRACREAEAVGTPDGDQALGWALLNLGGLFGKIGKLDLGFLTLHRARERLFALQNWVGVAASWEVEAKLRESLGDPERAREHLAEALAMYRKEGMAEKVEALQARIGKKAV
jgi:tetratricopeptide (TPR) repeat protein